MNKLVLIGNGFDLAHNMKTSYNDFICWYLKTVYDTTIELFKFNDDLIKSSVNAGHSTPVEITSVSDFDKAIKDYNINLEYQYSFLRDLIGRSGISNWVDIETFYYHYLVLIYKKLEGKKREYWGSVYQELIDLNTCFDLIKRKLIEYLEIIESRPVTMNPNIENHFENDIKQTNPSNRNQVYFLNFNYTSTVKKYLRSWNQEFVTLNHIHGQLNHISNPIIFGYGDEMDEFYTKLERINDNEFLKNIKSFGYFLTNNYLKFTQFMNNNRFNVYIMGHSCGLSDRVLLNSIFEHKNCNVLNLYYHQKSDDSDDYIERTMEISRHFKPESKGDMRTRLKSKLESKPL